MADVLVSRFYNPLFSTDQKRQGSAGERLDCPYCFFHGTGRYSDLLIWLESRRAISQLDHEAPTAGRASRDRSRKRNHTNSHFTPIDLIIALTH
jgi:hypothetical protein